MDSVEDYLSEILAAIRPVPVAELALADALGSVLAQDVTAEWKLPGFDSSAMDGYAVRSADVASASASSPVILPVDAEVAAGDTTQHTLVPGHCIKIMTGGLLPIGADAVIPVEGTDGGATRAAIREPAEPGSAIRRAGDDARPGDLLLPAGTRLGPAQIGVLAAAGHGRARARRRPRAIVISTGNELSEPGQPLVPGRIWDSNSYMLTAAASHGGCESARHPTVQDDQAQVLAAIETAAATADLLITSGGVSMGGEHDVVKAALSKLGTVTFRKVAIQPGMPQGFGLVGSRGTPIFTLPGNPVSAFVSFHLFVMPAVRGLQNLSAKRDVPRQARLTQPVQSPAGRRSFLRGILDADAGTVTPLTGQSSHQIASLARANALIVVPEPQTSLPACATVEILELP